METILFSTATVVSKFADELQEEKDIAKDYKEVDLSKFVPGLSTDNIINLAAPKYEKLDFITDDIAKGLIKLTVYENVYAIVFVGYDDLLTTWRNVIGIIGHDDKRGYTIIDGANSRVFKAENLEIKVRQYLNELNTTPAFRFVTFTKQQTPVDPPIKIKKEPVETPKKRQKIATAEDSSVGQESSPRVVSSTKPKTVKKSVQTKEIKDK